MQDDDLDRLLDSALAEYVDAPERPGLEARVLRRVLERRPRRSWLPWAWGIPALAAGLAVFVVSMPRDPGPPVPLQARMAAPHLEIRVSPPLAMERHPVKHLPARVTPRRPVFPTPSPLTGDERALFALAASHPEQMAGYAADIRHSADPLQIEPIRIEPLVSGN